MNRRITLLFMLLCAYNGFAANYLTFTAQEDSSTFTIGNYIFPPLDHSQTFPDVRYSLDNGETWTTLSGTDTVTLNKKGDKALLKGYNPEHFTEYPEIATHFSMTGSIAASGSVMSLIDSTGESKVIPNPYCFSDLFYNCQALTQAPELSATTLTDGCYHAMFSGCTSLTQAPALPVTTLAESCYLGMFAGCTSLTQAPELPATTLAEGCYNVMFAGCTSLAKAPKLPATTLGNHCYMGMFGRCTNLTQAPELPATTLDYNCYSGMFEECTSLKEAPELPAKVLVKDCYKNMFDGCTSLSKIRIGYTQWGLVEDMYSQSWVANVAPTGIFICPRGTAKDYSVNNIPEGWELVFFDYLTFTAKEDSSSFGIMTWGDSIPDLQYSLDSGRTWSPLISGEKIVLAKYDQAMMKGYNPQGFSWGEENHTQFVMSGSIEADGNVMSLIDGIGACQTIPNPYCFYGLFEQCQCLKRAPILSATTLTEGCYQKMFQGCTGLTQTPVLSAMKLAAHCYDSMFDGCGTLSLVNVSFSDWTDSEATLNWLSNVAPSGTFISPQKLAKEYGTDRIPEGWRTENFNYLTFTAEMDSSSFSITQDDPYFLMLYPNIQYSLDNGQTWAPLIGIDTIMLGKKGDKALLRGYNPDGLIVRGNNGIHFAMTGSVAASGSIMSLIDAAGVSKTIPSDFCFEGLFQNCANLIEAPELPATSLRQGCYVLMFAGCVDLKKAPELPATSLQQGCYMRMFGYCTSLTQAPELPAKELSQYCYATMFAECTNLTQAPELPATKLVEGCYENMFDSCHSISQIKVSFSEWEGMDNSWVAGVAPTGTFICPKELPQEYGINRIPEGWTVKISEQTGTENLASTDCTIWTENLSLFVRGAEGRIEVYDLNGKLLRSAQGKENETVRFVLPGKGTFVVKTEAKSVKVIL